MHNFLFFLTILNTFISRFFLIGKIPPISNTFLIGQRLISATLSVGTIILIYLYAKKIFRNKTLALISSFIYSLFPWTIEQGRIVSQVNNGLFFFLLMLILANKSKSLLVKAAFFSLTLLCFFFIYPQFWLFRTTFFFPKISDLLNNVFSLISFDLLFFKNPSFWWGGVREVGIIYLSLFPFLLIGIYKVFSKDRINILFWPFVILLFSSFSPFMPESREFFLIMPFLSMLIAVGLGDFFVKKNILVRMIFFLIFFFIIYDVAQFLHYYYIHYPQQVISNQSHINEPF